jgi:hypothetical protein
MNIQPNATMITRRRFCLWTLTGTAPFLLQVNLNGQENPPPTPAPPGVSGKDVFCRNPAYIFATENGQTCLRTTTKDGQRILFGLDVGGSAVWNALPGPAEIEAKRGATVEQVIATVTAAYPKMPPAKVKEGVLAFLAQALAAGVVLPTDKKMFCRARPNQQDPNPKEAK